MHVIYHKDTTKIARILRNKYWQDARFATEPAAKASRTRAKLDPEVWLIAEYDHFCTNIEKTVIVKNLMTGAEVKQRANTPRSCDVSSELYWSM